jgi:O-antigen ligase
VTPAAGRAGRVDRKDLPAYLLCFLGMIVFNMFSGNSKLLGFPIGPDRLLFAAGVALLLLDPEARRGRRLRFRPVHGWSLALIFLTYWSAAANNTLTATTGLYLMLDTIVVPFVMFCLAPHIFSTPGRRDLLVRLLICMGIYLGATAVFEMVGPKALVWPSYILDPSVGIHFGRARGPFAESEADGLVMAICSFASMYGVTRFRSRWRIAAIVSTLLCVIGITLALTRSVWLGAALGVTIVAMMSPKLRRLFPLAVAGLVGTVAIALAVVPGLQTLVSGRTADQRSLWDRANTDAAALRIVSERPLSGVGWANFVHVARDWVLQGSTYPITNIDISIHNVLLSRAAELGVFGALFTALALAYGPGIAVFRRQEGERESWRRLLIATAACVGVSAMLSPLPYPLVNLLLWLFTGIVTAQYQTIVDEETVRAEEREPAFA